MDESEKLVENSGPPDDQQQPRPLKRKLVFLCIFFFLAIGVFLVLLVLFSPPPHRPNQVHTKTLEYEKTNEYERQDDPSPSSVVAPRSMPELVYNEIPPDILSISYMPSGGMSNQEMELENALHMAHLLNRTLYVPMIGSHKGFYSRLTSSNLFPADRLIDFTLLSSWANVIPLNITLFALQKRFQQVGKSILKIATTHGPFETFSLTQLREMHNTPMLFFGGKRMWKKWWSQDTFVKPQAHLSYTPYLRNLSIQVVNKAMGGKEFYAIHGRLGDQINRWEGKTSYQAFVKTKTFRSWNPQLRIYLASDDVNNRFFDSLRSTKRIVTLNDLMELDEMKEFSQLFPSKQVQMDMLGVMDKLICTQAKDFMGTWFSTFSWDIERFRSLSKSVFPELKSG